MENPFRDLGAPPATDAPPAEQLRYLEGVIEGFRNAGSPRIKPLQKQLTDALERLQRGLDRGTAPEEIAAQLSGDVAALRLQTFEILLVVVNQVRATLRVKLQGGLPTPERLDVEALNRGLGLYAQGVRKLVAAFKKNDEQAVRQASEALDEASALMSQSGQTLVDAPPA